MIELSAAPENEHQVCRTIGVFIVLISLNICAQSQQEEDTPKQLWPQVNIYVPVDEKVQLFFLFLVTKAEETRENTEAQVGAHVDYAVNKRLVLRAGYRYKISLTETDPFREHRPILEQNFRQPLPLGILLSDRNREEFAAAESDHAAEAVILDVYYVKQNDSRSEPHHLHAIGVVLGIHF